MALKELNCDGEIENDEMDSVISERCWRREYANDSRKWIMRDGTSTKNYGQVTSTFRDTYRFPKTESISPLLGRRTKMIGEQLLKEAQEEALGVLNKPPEIEDYVTSYDNDYRSYIPGFVPKDPLVPAPELYSKHPLYGSQPMTFWRFQHERGFGDRFLINGQTPVKDINNPFRRSSNFSKPVDEQDGTLQN